MVFSVLNCKTYLSLLSVLLHNPRIPLARPWRRDDVQVAHLRVDVVKVSLNRDGLDSLPRLSLWRILIALELGAVGIDASCVNLLVNS